MPNIVEKTRISVPDDFKQMEDPIELYKKFSTKHFIRALNDDVIAYGDYQPLNSIPSTFYKELPGGHNFTGRSRIALLEYISTIL